MFDFKHTLSDPQHRIRYGWLGFLCLAGLGAIWLASQHLSFDTLMHPEFLWGWLVLPGVVVLAWRGIKKRRQACEAYAEWGLLHKMNLPQVPVVEILRLFLICLALSLMILALARPQGDPVLTDSEGQGIDIMVAMDISNSTRTEDILPNRLEAEKTIVVDLLRQLSFDRVGLLVFSSEAFPLAPFTNDYEALETLMHEINHDLLGAGGTDFAHMLHMAQERFRAAGSTGKLLIVLSDGENHSDASTDAAMQQLQQDQIKLITIGIGTSKGGKIPSHTDFWGNVVYKSYQGEDVISQLNEASLKQLAQQGGGHYLSAANSNQLISEIKRLRNQMAKKNYKLANILAYEEKYQIFLLLALLCLLAERLIYLQESRVQDWIRHGQAKLRAWSNKWISHRSRPAKHSGA